MRTGLPARFLSDRNGAVLVENVFVLTFFSIVCIAATGYVVARMNAQLQNQQAGYRATAVSPPQLPADPDPGYASVCPPSHPCNYGSSYGNVVQ